MALTEAQIKAKKEYRKKCRQISVEFSPTDSDLYEHVSSKESKSGYIKELIRKDMERNE